MSEQGQVVSATEQHAAEGPLPASVGLTQPRAGQREASPHSHKFRVVTAALVGIAIGAIAITVSILLSHGTPGPRGAWSAWSPPDGGVAGEREIAQQVAPFYRASPAVQLVVVTVQNVSGSATGSGLQVAVRDPTSGQLASLPGNTAVYNLCGLGANCAIAAGAPSAARLLLLRREALELALYTFKYIGGTQNVVAILPPGHTITTGQLTPRPPTAGQKTTSSTVNVAVVFDRQSLKRFIDQPLQNTLPEQLAPTVAQMSNAPEAELVSVITGQALFNQQLIQAQDGSNVLVLNQLPPQ
jgi:hypothetical protein